MERSEGRLVSNRPVIASLCAVVFANVSIAYCQIKNEFIHLPVKMRSIARDSPIRRGRRTVPPSMRGTPNRRHRTPRRAPSSTTLIWHHSANLSKIMRKSLPKALVQINDSALPPVHLLRKLHWPLRSQACWASVVLVPWGPYCQFLNEEVLWG